MFEIRGIESDISFHRNYLKKDLVMRENMYLFQKKVREYKIVAEDWESVRDQLVSMRLNGGFLYIAVNEEVYLMHWFEDI